MTKLRVPARYLNGPFPLTVEQAKEMLQDAKAMYQFVSVNNPVRHKC
jgi:hypothetical protein